MSMIRSGIGTPEAFRHHALAQRVAGGLNARDHILGPLQARARTWGYYVAAGSRNVSIVF